VIGEAALVIARMVGRGRTAIALVIGGREKQLVTVRVIGRRGRRFTLPADRPGETPVISIGIVGWTERQIVRVGAIGGKRPRG
jgi:hypothetical protein